MCLLDWIFPPQCIICSRAGYEICTNCLLNLPRALPSCCVCGKISNNGMIHRECNFTNIPIVYKRGWYRKDSYQREFNKRKDLSLYGIYKYLLLKIVKDFALEKEIESSIIFPLDTEKEEDISINKYLSNSLQKRKEGKILFLVGEKLSSIENLKSQIHQLQGNPLEVIIVLTIF